MIDFHNHILPAVDDGAKSIEESLNMLKYAEDQGITEIVNTVHFQHPKMEQKSTEFDYISNVKDELVEAMDREKIEIKIHLGAEVFFNFNLTTITSNPLVTLCNVKYMLVEFQTHQFPEKFDDHLFQLAISGITPIIAHPERYKPIQNDISIIEKLINSGSLVQMDAGSLLGHFGPNCKTISENMLKRKMVHIIGSDSHNLGRRNFCLKKALGVVENIVDYDFMPLVQDNPRKVIDGDKINIPEFQNFKKDSFSMKIRKRLFK